MRYCWPGVVSAARRRVKPQSSFASSGYETIRAHSLASDFGVVIPGHCAWLHGSGGIAARAGPGFSTTYLNENGNRARSLIRPCRINLLLLAIYSLSGHSSTVADPFLCIIDRPMEQGLTCETSDSAVYCLTSALVGGVEVRECSRTKQAPLRASFPPSTASDLDNDRCRSGQPRRDGADGAVQGDNVQTSSRIIQRSCGFMVSRPRCWSRPDSARAIVGAVPRRFRLQRHAVCPTPSGCHGPCKHPLLSAKRACYRHRDMVT